MSQGIRHAPFPTFFMIFTLSSALLLWLGETAHTFSCIDREILYLRIATLWEFT